MSSSIFKKNQFVQLHAAIVLMGYWLVSAILGVFVGETPQIVSIAYRAVQLLLSIRVLVLCRENIRFHKGNPLLSFFVITMFLFSFRMIIDFLGGPFVGQIPSQWFLNDFLYVIVSIFISLWAMFASSKYLDINRIAGYVFWMGFVTLICVYLLMGRGQINYEEGRVDAGRGLGTLSIAKMGAFVVLAAVHLLVNGRKEKVILKVVYFTGIVLGVFISLASGSRGGVAGMVLALGAYWILSTRRNYLSFILAVVSVIVVYVNIVPILEFMSNFFPVISNRFLMTVLENDQSGRQEIRQYAVRLILENPIFGYSYRLFPTANGYGPHNGILEIFLALGIPYGLMYLYFIWIKGFVCLFKTMPYTKFCFATTMTVFVMVTAMSGGSIDEQYFGFSICLLGSAYYYGYLGNSSQLSELSVKIQ